MLTGRALKRTAHASIPDVREVTSQRRWAEEAIALEAVVPRRFLWVADMATLGIALLLARLIAPHLQRWVMQVDALQRVDWLAVPAVIAGGLRTPLELVAISFVIVPATMAALQSLGGYRPLLQQSILRLVISCMLAPVLGVSILSLVVFGLRVEGLSRILVFLFALFGILGLLSYRVTLRLYKSARLKAGHYAQRAVIIGLPETTRWLSSHIGRIAPETQYKIVGYLTVPAEGFSSLPDAFEAVSGQSETKPCLGPVQSLANILISSPVNEVIALLPESQVDWLSEVIESCSYYRVTLRIVPHALLVGTLPDLQTLYHLDTFKLPEVLVSPAGMSPDALFVKRLLDVVVAGTSIIVLSPLLALITLAIKITTPRLPVLYPWRVVGDKGRLFTGYKFTTMQADSDARSAQQDLAAHNEMDGPVFKIKQDPRVTPFGRVLRKYSLNELPQLWSVLKGDMSLVGPRPAFPHELERYELWHKRKLSVKPGITCLWQVRGRNRIRSFDDWVRMDLEYIDNWSFWLDLKILVRTAWVVLRGTGS